MTQRILNAQPSGLDARDYELVLDTLAPLPARFTWGGLGPVLDQGQTGTCVSHAGDGVRQWQEKRDGHGVIPADPFKLYDLCKLVDGQPDPGRQYGTSLRTVLRVLKGSGTPLYGGGNGGKIATYYRIATVTDTIKRALIQHGPILTATDWDANWMYLGSSHILKAPVGHMIGGHAFYLWGWDDHVNGGSFLMRNSWGRDWSTSKGTGNAYMAFRYWLDAQPESWYCTDVVGD